MEAISSCSLPSISLCYSLVLAIAVPLSSSYLASSPICHTSTSNVIADKQRRSCVSSTYPTSTSISIIMRQSPTNTTMSIPSWQSSRHCFWRTLCGYHTGNVVFGRTDLTGEEDAAGFLGAVVSGKGNIDADNQGGEATLGRRISRNAEQATPER